MLRLDGGGLVRELAAGEISSQKSGKVFEVEGLVCGENWRRSLGGLERW